MRQVERDVAVHNVAHVRVRDFGVGTVRHVRAQEHRSPAAGHQVLRGSRVLDTFVDGRVSRGNVRGPVAQRRRHVHDTLRAQLGPAPGQNVQPLHHPRVDHLPHCRAQPTRL